MRVDDAGARQNWRVSLIGLVIALSVISLPVGAWIHASASLTHRIAYELTFWALVAAILIYVRTIERRPLSSIGFRRLKIRDGFIGIGAGVAILACLALLYYVLFPALHWTESNQMASLGTLPYWLNVLIVVRAAVSEEILFRGYAMERLQEMSGSRVVAAVVSCTIFTVDHVGFWGWHHILIAGSAGLVLTLLYLWRRNVWINIIAHFIVDASAFLA